MGRSGGAIGLKPSPLLKIFLLSSSTFHIMTNTRSQLRCGPKSSHLPTLGPSILFLSSSSFPPKQGKPPSLIPFHCHPFLFPSTSLHSRLTPTALIRSPGMFWSRSRALPLACHTTCLWCSMCSSSSTSWNIHSASAASSTLLFRWGSWEDKSGGRSLYYIGS